MSAASAKAGSLTVAGSPSVISTLAAQPCALAVFSTISRAIFRSGWRSAGSSARSVPPASAESGMMFSADPARNHPTLKTAACIGFKRRLTSDWSAMMEWERANIGSCARCG